MRTTLKKGMYGARNGFGELPPDPLELPALGATPRALYQQPRRNPLRVVGKVLLWLALLALVAAGSLAGGVWLFFNYSVAAVRPHSKEVIEAQKILEAPAPGQPTVAMVIGYDKRPGDSASGSRSDTVMLLRADPRLKAVTLLSFPRDLVVDIPGCKGQGPFRARINEAFTYCGPRGTLATVKELTGIPVNYMVTVNFSAFMRIVDKLGGVYLDVDRRYFNDNSGLGAGQTYATINLRPGYQRLTGRQALDFVRFRHTDSDFYRVVRQQEFVKAFKQQVSSSWSLFQLPGIVNTITHNVEVAKGGKEAIDTDEVLGYAQLAYRLPAGNFQQVQIEGFSGYFELDVPEEQVDQAVNRFLHPDTEAPEKALSVATGGPAKTKSGPPPSAVSLEVLNGNGVAGAADDAAYLLSQRGYRAVNGGNAETFDYFHTTVLYDAGSEDGRAAADAVATLFGDADVQAADTGLETTLRVVVGKTFGGTLAPAPRDTTPKHEPPAVVVDPGSVAPLLRRAQRKVDFPVLVPVKREKSSSLSSEEGVRAYGIEGHRALRLTYRTGTDEYWGIQQTSWTDAPVLNGPTLTRKIGAREYKLYFSGPKLHMVAFEEKGAAYWVVNTLLNKLSNETMLAIAKSLRPLGRG
jgi:LCP family protein required for cell wall assembly